jgi:protoheme IX farnesyltransferase
MRRTAGRPLTSGRLQPETVLWFGLGACVLGLVWLAAGVNPLTAWVGGFTVGVYLFIYTPLKRLTWLNTLVGAIPGALPPLMGWTAARNDLSLGGWGLFAILFFWQIPHFLAIAWLYREEYARAGFIMLPNVDADGTRTARQALAHALGLAGVSLLPVLLGLAGTLYLVVAAALGGAFVAVALRFSRALSLTQARQLFLASILYLPLLLGLLAWDKCGS